MSMHRFKRFRWALISTLWALLGRGMVYAQGLDPDAERAQRRVELRQQLHAERGRWRSDPVSGGARLGGMTESPAPGAWPAGAASLPRPAPRLSAEERRDLRRELREARP
jgi:hypothetical protein